MTQWIAYLYFWSCKSTLSINKGSGCLVEKIVLDTIHWALPTIIPCVLSYLFWFMMHGRYAWCFVNKGVKIMLNGFTLILCLHKMEHISHALHRQSIETKGMGWWGSVHCIPSALMYVTSTRSTDPCTLRRNSSLHCLSSSKHAIQLYKDSLMHTQMKIYSGVSCFFWECVKFVLGMLISWWIFISPNLNICMSYLCPYVLFII